MKKALILIAINFAIICTLIVSVEILSQLVYLAKTGNFFVMEDVIEARSVARRIFEIHPYLAGRLRVSVVVQDSNETIKTTGFHTRWTGGNQDDNDLIRIAILGGSTAFGTHVTDEDSWPALLQAKHGKGFSVINYSVPGYSTAEAILQMALIVPEKGPHFAIFYEGWNDIRNYHEKEFGADYYGHGIRQYGDLGIPIYQNKKSSLFATTWLKDKIKNKISKPTENRVELFSEPDLFVDKIYIRNLKTLKLLAENIHAFGVIIPQALNCSSYHGKEGSKAWTRHIKNDAMPALMDRFNSQIEGLCTQRKSNCVVLSEVTKEKWLPDDFVDDGHFSNNGGLKYSEMVAQFIRSKYSSVITEKSVPQGAPPNRFSAAPEACLEIPI